MRTVTIAIAAFLSLAAAGCGGSVAEDRQPLANPPVYLALGDSIPFGDNALVYPPNNDNVFDATSYPWYLGKLEDIRVVNAACPGETSASFITFGAPDNGCLEFRSTYDALHVDYAGSQLEFALDYLATHSRVRLVTVALGANDLFLLQQRCLGDASCIAAGLPDAFRALGANLARILGALRAAGYAGQIVVPLYYNPVPSPLYDLAVQGMDFQVLAPVAGAFAADVADVYHAFQAASAPSGDPCVAGLLIRYPDGTCSVHPNAQGAQLIAATIAPLVAPWTGKP